MSITFEKGRKKEVRIFRRITKDILVRTEEVVLHRNSILELDVEIIIEDDGEFLLL